MEQVLGAAAAGVRLVGIRTAYHPLRRLFGRTCTGSVAPGAARGLILKQMLYQSPALDLMFHALADPTRRLIVERLTRGPATVSDLARPFDMTLPAVVQHLRVLEAGGLVTSEKLGRVRTCRVEPAALRTAERWISERRTAWEARLDRLGEYLAQHPGPEPTDKKRSSP
jgi:DNA-binding transcriptional ArsR family regulator